MPLTLSIDSVASLSTIDSAFEVPELEIVITSLPSAILLLPVTLSPRDLK